MQIVSAEASLLFIEEKEVSLQEALDDLKRKWNGFSSMHYGDVKNLPALAAGGKIVQWYLLPDSGQQVPF